MEYYNKIDEVYLNALKQSIVRPVFKIELMDFAENVIGELTQDISNEDAGSISINYQQGLRRSCSLTLINVNDNLNIKQSKYPLDENGLWINTKFKLYTGIKVSKLNSQEHKINVKYSEEVLYSDDELLYRKDTQKTEEDIYWFSQGVFLLTDPSVFRDMSKKTITINGVDKFGVFGSETNFTQTEGTYIIEANSMLGNVVNTILNFSRGNGFVLDIKPPYFDLRSGIYKEKLPYEINKSPETYLGEILIELANTFACDIYYDTEGRLHFEKGNESLGMEDFGSLWDYSDKEPEYFSPQLNYDFTSVYNVIKVVGNNPNANLFEATAKNDSLSSPTRIQLLGEKIFYIESSFCDTQQRADDFANYMLRKKSMTPLTLSFQSSFIPHLDVNRVITITDEYYNYSQQRFIIQSLTIPLSTKSLMSVECTNIANIPYFEY